MRANRNNNLSTLWLALIVATPLLAGGAPVAAADGQLEAITVKPRIMFAMEFLEPTEKDRRLDTTSIDLLLPFKSYEKLRLTLLAGLTATRASGEITQLTGELEEGTLEEVEYESPGTGIGPSFLATFDILRRSRLSASLHAGGAVILYDRDFPAGGDRYNFMWRIGPSLSYRLADSYAVGISYRWMHVSNGQGLSAENPSYEAEGLSLQISRAF